MTVLVVGATGTLGGGIVGRLAGDERVRALVRASSDPARVEELRSLGAEIAVGDLLDRPSLDGACAGVDAVVSTATSIAREGEISGVDREGQLNLVDAARAAGVRRVVYVSFEEFGSGSPIEAAKRAVEAALRASGMTYTILQPGLFHETWLSPVTGFDLANGSVAVYGSGEAELSWIAVGDVAAAAAAAIREPAAENAVVPLAGDRMSYRAIVELYERETGRTLTVNQVPEAALVAQRDAAPDERGRSFAGLMLGVASGSPPNDGREWLRRLGVERPVTVRDVVTRPAS